MRTFTTIASIIAGIFIIYLGYLIRVKKMLSLIIGYSDSTFYGDKDKYAKRTGFTAIILGIIVAAMPLVVFVFGEGTIHIYKYMIGVYVVLIIIMANYWRFRL
ncbi:DUF3784 domain-containing protein [Bacillus sp. FJAT-49711]|uniref:DUF3784 domain-containing protein n=1 Tax=Bacillus sp. FJAT-49711 TaxID=2833585 RepID=UPI001BC996D0|nr:DUF3784 domain-containing protein [Bacillus sp. FJAT-49711]MBS4220519.1 DUF3784 domain-containing protein [Bacillus sp. FJAT-49711]